MTPDAELLAGLDPFEGLSEDVLETLADCAHHERVGPGTLLFKEGDQADRFYGVLSGGVSLSVYVPHRGHVHVDTVRAGEVVGWGWLLPPHTFHLDGRVMVDSELLVVDGRCIRGKLDADPALGYLLVQRFAEVIHRRLQGTRLRLLDLLGSGDAG